MTACLESLEPIRNAVGAGSVDDAWERPELAEADLVIVEAATADVHRFLRRLRVTHGTPSLACGPGWHAGGVAAVVEARAVGVIAKETLPPATLEANVRAALQG